MPSPTLRVPLRTFLERNQRHRDIANGLSALDIGLQKAVAELLVIRLFDDFLEAMAGTAYRLGSGAVYLDGTPPGLLTTPARSVPGARSLYQEHGRTKPTQVKWSLVKHINETTRYVIDRGDPFLRGCNSHALVISEMCAIRNRIAHSNQGSRKSFSDVLRRHYGGVPRGVSPGTFLLSQRFSPTRIEFYLAASRLILRDCTLA